MLASVEDFDRVMAVNVRGTFLCVKLAGEQMIKQGNGGRIIGQLFCRVYVERLRAFNSRFKAASSVAGKKGQLDCVRLGHVISHRVVCKHRFRGCIVVLRFEVRCARIGPSRRSTLILLAKS
jgi:hypothetical protein